MFLLKSGLVSEHFDACDITTDGRRMLNPEPSFEESVKEARAEAFLRSWLKYKKEKRMQERE